jgi:hypothetical protein
MDLKLPPHRLEDLGGGEFIPRRDVFFATPPRVAGYNRQFEARNA